MDSTTPSHRAPLELLKSLEFMQQIAADGVPALLERDCCIVADPGAATGDENVSPLKALHAWLRPNPQTPAALGRCALQVLGCLEALALPR